MSQTRVTRPKMRCRERKLSTLQTSLDTCGRPERRETVSKAEQDIRRKRRALVHAAHTGNVRQTCRYFGIPRCLFYVWKRAHEREGEGGLVNRKPVARSHPKTTPAAIVEQILHLRRT